VPPSGDGTNGAPSDDVPASPVVESAALVVGSEVAAAPVSMGLVPVGLALEVPALVSSDPAAGSTAGPHPSTDTNTKIQPRTPVIVALDSTLWSPRRGEAT
jgi:hypothetical protein